MESSKHHLLVKKIYEYVSSLNYVEKGLIQSDIFEVPGNVTCMPERYVPDLFYSYKNNLIIGEAKTDDDLEKEHSHLQYKSYFDYIKSKSADGFNCVFVLSVPWEDVKTAFRICKKYAGKICVKIVILNELGVYKEYEKDNTKE